MQPSRLWVESFQLEMGRNRYIFVNDIVFKDRVSERWCRLKASGGILVGRTICVGELDHAVGKRLLLGTGQVLFNSMLFKCGEWGREAERNTSSYHRLWSLSAKSTV